MPKTAASKPAASQPKADAAEPGASKAAVQKPERLETDLPRIAASNSASEVTEAHAPRDSAAAAHIADGPETPSITKPPIDAEVTSPSAPDADSSLEDSASLDVDSAAADEAVTDSAATDSAATDSDAIRIRGLVKRFGDSTAVADIDLTVPVGSFYGLVGPNGAGKTTTLSIIAGLLRPDAGTVHIAGIDQRANPLAAKKAMGVLPDRLRTFDRLTGRQLLHYYGQLRGLDRSVIEKRTADLARAFDLTEALSRVVSDYSAGMTKKLMLAGALIHSPRVLVLDEPFEAVDPVSSGVILDILRSYVSHGGTVILSSHGMDLVERVCSRVAVIVGGEVLAEGTIDDVRAGQTLAARFVELSGSAGEVEGLEWLHTFSA
ncbi:ATP-binding transport protein NatA [Microbacterium esteraromaticum]|uniref:ATP-binding transport protein NatA n=1 Tax=Microbacterium esteraromaticum TaxID=57043 RepID=A0A1R4JRQ4_9MICO|nr:ABC transporter ATP-binding protein [Microbacterium esteraromaticum]SJN34634.1 ATP-binding transport protein NatA [Microbacterium esteraromaticum]